jgi:hypothetical protein
VPEAIRDEVLVERARGGDQPAFLLLYERYRDEIFRFLYLLSGSIKVAEEVAHDCFFSLIKEFGEVQADTSASLLTQLYSLPETWRCNTLAIRVIKQTKFRSTEARGASAKYLRQR